MFFCFFFYKLFYFFIMFLLFYSNKKSSCIFYNYSIMAIYIYISKILFAFSNVIFAIFSVSKFNVFAIFSATFAIKRGVAICADSLTKSLSLFTLFFIDALPVRLGIQRV